MNIDFVHTQIIEDHALASCLYKIESRDSLLENARIMDLELIDLLPEYVSRLKIQGDH